MKMFRRNEIKTLLSALRRTSLCNQTHNIYSRNFQKVSFLGANFNNALNSLATDNLGKVFVEHENQYAHKILENSLKPYQILKLDLLQRNEKEIKNISEFILNPPASNEDVAIEDLFKEFCFMAEYCRQNNLTIADEKFTRFIELFCEKTHLLDDEQLLEILRQMATMPSTKSTRDKNFVELWNNLDVECEYRVQKWKPEKLLLFADAWYKLNLGRVSEFVWEAMRKLGRRVVKMPPEQLVQTMFFCNILRKPLIEMFNFEVNLAKCAHQLSLEELGVMAMGFFKTETPIRNPALLEHLYRRLMNEIDSVEDITLVSLLKVLRYSTRLNQNELIYELMDKICPQIDRISSLSCVHAILLGTELQICHDDLMESVIKRLLKELPKTRIKDLERISLAMGLMNYSSPEGLDRVLATEILKSLHNRIEEIMRHPKSLPLCLHFLTLKGHYNMEMISNVLEQRYIQHAYGRNVALSRDIFFLDAFVKINLKGLNYQGNQLSEKQRATMGKILTKYIPDKRYKLNLTDSILVEIKETLTSIYKECEFKHILPHFERPDIVFCYDKKRRKPLPISKECPEDYSGEILSRKELLGKADSPDLLTIAIVVAGWNNVVRGKERLTGLFDMKLKQMRLLGHKTIVIYWYEWREVEEEDRQKFLKRKLTSLIK